MTTHKNLMTLCVAAVFAVGLAACGGGNGDGPDTGMDDTDTGMDDTDTGMDDTDTGPTDPPPTPVAVNVDDVTEGCDVEDGMVVVPAGDTMPYGDIDFTCDDGGDACTVMVTNNADDGTVSIMSTGGMVTAQDSRAYLESQLAAIEKETQEARDKAMRDERIARVAEVRTSIMSADTRVPTADGMTANDGYAAKLIPVGSSGVTGVTRTYDSDAGTVTVDVNGATTEDDYMGGTVPASDSGWDSAMLTKTNDNESTDTLVIYTEAPSDIKITERYTLDDVIADTADEDVNTKYLMATQFPGAGDTRVYDGDNFPKSFRGSFDGVDGVFACVGDTDCTISTGENTDGEFTLSSNQTWTFTPDNPNTDTVKDTRNYAYFGWWLNKPEKDSDPHTVEVFLGGVDNNYAADITDEVKGNATYKGPAAGKYVTTTSRAGVQTDAGVGHFTADANLTAKFGTSAAGTAGTIKGSVINFMLDDTTPASWRVMLEEAGLTDDSPTFTGTTEVNFGGGVTDTEGGGAGYWQGSFYNDDDDDEETAPGTVSGRFDAITNDASVTGAFGATKQ